MARPREAAVPRQHLVTYAGHYANAAGNLKSREPEAEAEPETEIQPIKQAGTGFRRYSWAELIKRVWNVDPQECPKCGEKMQRQATLKGEELKGFLESINRLGYPARPPPVSWQDSNEFQEPFSDFFSDFGEDSSQQFHNYESSQIPPGWESSDAIA